MKNDKTMSTSYVAHVEAPLYDGPSPTIKIRTPTTLVTSEKTLAKVCWLVDWFVGILNLMTCHFPFFIAGCLPKFGSL